MKALTLHAPWAWAICYLGKDIENRTWKPPAAMIGQRSAIHAGSPSMWKFRKWWEVYNTLKRKQPHPKIWRSYEQIFKCTDEEYAANRDSFWFAIVATAVISEVREPQSADDGWHVAGQYGWVLTDVQVLHEPVKCKGALGLWTVPADIETKMETRA